MPASDDGCEADLTLVDDCGGCGHDCQGGGCHTGQCASLGLISGLTQPRQLVVDKNYVHWLGADPMNSGQSEVERMTTSGTDVTRVLYDQNISAIASDGTYIYWSVPGTSSTTLDSSIWRVKSGTNTPVDDVRTGVSTGTIAADANNVYWSDLSSNAVVGAYPRDGTAVTTLIEKVSLVHSMVSDGSTLYVGSDNRLDLVTLGKPGSVSLTSLQALKLTPTGYSVAADSSHVFAWFRDASSAHLMRLSKPDFGTPVDLAESDSTDDAYGPVAVVGTTVFFVESDGLYRVPVDKSSAAIRVDEIVGTLPTALAASDGFLFWLEQGATAQASIHRLAVY
ncbi:MAG TPA: hypothetical protein VHC69_23840 [Polyangiaceae bacterium]|nr:hypothetical protein [Polyangiaceae bacterium]